MTTQDAKVEQVHTPIINDVPAADNYTVIDSIESLKEIKPGIIYGIPGNKFDNLFEKGFLVIKSNRKELKQIEAKKQSCQKVGMTTNALVVPASIAKKAGYILVNPITRQEATDEEIPSKLTIMEGNTRAHACYSASKEKKPFDYIFTLSCYSSPEQFRNAYRQTNLCNERTKVKDYTNDVLTTETENPILKSYRDKCHKGLAPKAAAFATLGKEITKNDITSIFNGKMPSSLGESSILQFSERIYDVVFKTFSPTKITPIVKGTVFWKWTASKLNNAKNDQEREDVTTQIEKVFKEMNASVSNQIRDAKGSGGKTKEQHIHALLENEYQKY